VDIRESEWMDLRRWRRDCCDVWIKGFEMMDKEL